MAPNNREIIPLIILVAIGATLRLYGLETQSFWNDELHSALMSGQESLAAVVEKLERDVNPPGYFFFLYFVITYIGNTEFVLRLPSAIAGILCIPAIYMLGRKLYSHREGWIAAALMTFFWCPVYYSQEARVYSILLLCVIWASGLWLNMVASLQKNGALPRAESLTYILLAVVTSYLHSFGLFFIVLQGFWGAILLLKHKRDFLKLLWIYALVLLAYSPWMSIFFSQFSNQGVDWIDPPNLKSVLKYLKVIFGPTEVQLASIAGFIFLLSRGLKKNIREAPQKFTLMDSPSCLLALWLVIPFAIIYIASIFFKPMLVNRYLIILLPAAYLLLARSITQLPIKFSTQIIIIVLVIASSSYHTFIRKEYYSKPTKTQYRETVRLITDKLVNHENSLVIGNRRLSLLNYYFEKNGSTQIAQLAANKLRDYPMVASYIKTSQPGYIWYVAIENDYETALVEALGKTYAPQGYWTFHGTEIWLFQD